MMNPFELFICLNWLDWSNDLFLLNFLISIQNHVDLFKKRKIYLQNKYIHNIIMLLVSIRVYAEFLQLWYVVLKNN